MSLPSRGAAGRRGGTLVEVAVTVGLLVVFAGGTVTLGRSLSRAFRSETEVAQRDAHLHAALDRMAARLRAADGEAILPAGISAPFHSSWIEFRRVTGHDGANVVWGDTERLQFEYEVSDLDDGLDNDGDGLVDEGRIVWVRDPGGPNESSTVLASSVPEVHVGELAGNGIDDDGNGLEDEGGLAFEVTDDRIRIVLSLESIDAEAQRQSASGERTVVMRNTGVSAP